jgi:hypothetical protein
MSGRSHQRRCAHYLFIAAAISAALQSAPAQSQKAFAPDKMETILYGVAYYPEYMPDDRLDKDVELMQKAGISVVRVGESTGSSWEPREGFSVCLDGKGSRSPARGRNQSHPGPAHVLHPHLAL